MLRRVDARNAIGVTLATVVMGTFPALSQQVPTYPGCDNLANSQFTVTELFNKTGSGSALTKDNGLAEPVQMDLHGVYDGTTLKHVDIYFVERMGKVKRYDGGTKTVSTIGTIQVHGKDDNALFGIQLSPDFTTSRLIYLWYTPPAAGTANRHIRLTRVKLKDDYTLDMATEKVLLDILGSKSDQWHSGGPMQFDKYGDLWIAIGNNGRDLDASTFTHYGKDSAFNAEWGPGNTANMRGGFLRIHPDNSEKGYSIPADNFGEYWAKQFESKGRTALAALYRDPKKVLPEIYVKGTRSNFSLAVHPTKRWLAWGEVNYASNNDEFNIVAKPTFTGFPYFHGPNVNIFGQQETYGFKQDVNAPRNVSTLAKDGVDTLPPAKGANMTNLVNVAIGGPIYVYDRNNPSTTKFPPHFHNTWLSFGFNGGIWLNVIDTTNENDIKLTSSAPAKIDGGIFSRAQVRNLVQGRYGPDGALYLLNYSGYYSTTNPGVMRMEYNGTCQLPPVSVQAQRQPLPKGVNYTAGSWTVGTPGEHRFELVDMQGHVVLSRTGISGARYQLSELQREAQLSKGVLMVRIHHADGVYSQPVPSI